MSSGDRVRVALAITATACGAQQIVVSTGPIVRSVQQKCPVPMRGCVTQNLQRRHYTDVSDEYASTGNPGDFARGRRQVEHRFAPGVSDRPRRAAGTG